jgi:uncharacterized protein (DUF4415 family)
LTTSPKQNLPKQTLSAERRRPGRPKLDNPKQAVSLRLEPEVLAKFRATGPGWQRRMNEVLKAAVLENPTQQ